MNTKRDTILVGGSAGGLGAVRTLLAQLPDNLAAAVFVVLHQHPNARPLLVDALQPSTTLPLALARDGERIEPGRVYLAPPDLHLLIYGDAITLSHGPRENRARPAINPLFLTAAAARTSRTIAVLLTGLLDDGVAGLEAVRRCGGLTMVQDPEDAEFPELPRQALQSVAVDHVLPLVELGSALAAQAGREAPSFSAPEDLILEAQMSAPGRSSAERVETIGKHAAIGCPDCGGPMWEIGDGATSTYRCSIGHVLTPMSLLEEQYAEIERSLWVAVRTLQERATLLAKLVRQAKERGWPANREQEAAAEAAHHAEQAKNFLLRLRATESKPEGWEAALSQQPSEVPGSATRQ